MAHGGGEPRIGDQRRRVGDVAGAVATERLGEALQGAAGDDVAGADSAGRLIGGDDGVGFGQLLAPALAGGLGREQDAEVRGQRLEPADLDDLDAGVRCPLVEGVDRPPHERDLSGQVDVVGAVLDAGFDHRRAVEGVGADQIEDDPGPRGHRRQRGWVADVGDDRLRRRAADLVENPLELAEVAAGHGPAEVSVVSPTGEVGGHPAAGDSAGTEDDDR